jgi:DNA-binding transcriptional LysR family regulator
MDWDDLRLVLSVCRAGTLSGAARALGVNYSTVFRRINGIEKDHKFKLFERHPHGYVMTEAGEAVMRHAERMEEAANAVSRELLGTDTRLSGTIKLTAPEGVTRYALMPHLEEFCKQHPDIELDLIITSSSLYLERNEADLAVRVGKRPPQNYIAREVCKFSFGTYGSPEYIEKNRHLTPLEHTFVEHRDDPRPWWATEKDRVKIVFKSDSMLVNNDAVRRGLGLISTPHIVGSRVPGLQRLNLPVKDIERTLWLLMHPDLRGTARVKALMNHLLTGLQKDADAFVGKSKQYTQHPTR